MSDPAASPDEIRAESSLGAVDAVPPGEDAEPGLDTPSPMARPVVVALSGLVTAALLLAMVVVPAPYAIEGPGPTVDVLGESDGAALIQVEGAPAYPTEGSLRLTTVAVRGGPNNPVDVTHVVLSWLSADEGVVPVEQVYPKDRSESETADLLAAQMTSSQESATIAALTELGYDVPAELLIAGAVQGSGADGVIAEGDVLLGAGGVALPTYQALADVLGATPPGTDLAVELGRSGERLGVRVVTGDDGSGGSVLGVFLDPEFDPPVDVTVTVDEIGGPSAGLIFALGILDTLTPGAMTGGASIAGTGTMSVDGRVGPISGILKKMAGAARDGATYFLSPAANCEEALGDVPDGLRLVGVATLAEARAAVTAIGEGRLDDLPGCAA